jgi:hypothetical protein
MDAHRGLSIKQRRFHIDSLSIPTRKIRYFEVEQVRVLRKNLKSQEVVFHGVFLIIVAIGLVAWIISARSQESVGYSVVIVVISLLSFLANFTVQYNLWVVMIHGERKRVMKTRVIAEAAAWTDTLKQYGMRVERLPPPAWWSFDLYFS